MENSDLQRMQADIANLFGMCSALRYLLEVDFAYRFAGSPEAFEEVMEQLIRLTQTSATSGEPATAEARLEGAAQTAAHLQRFALLTAARIRDRRGT